MAKFDIKSIAVGFAAGLAVAAAGAQAGQGGAEQPPAEHAHGQAQDAAPQHGQEQDATPQHGQEQSGQHGGMMDPAMRQQMMERMRQCHETMSTMMRHMEEMEGHAGGAHQQP